MGYLDRLACSIVTFCGIDGMNNHQLLIVSGFRIPSLGGLCSGVLLGRGRATALTSGIGTSNQRGPLV